MRREGTAVTEGHEGWGPPLREGGGTKEGGNFFLPTDIRLLSLFITSFLYIHIFMQMCWCHERASGKAEGAEGGETHKRLGSRICFVSCKNYLFEREISQTKIEESFHLETRKKGDDCRNLIFFRVC